MQIVGFIPYNAEPLRNKWRIFESHFEVKAKWLVEVISGKINIRAWTSAGVREGGQQQGILTGAAPHEEEQQGSQQRVDREVHHGEQVSHRHRDTPLTVSHSHHCHTVT